MNNDLVSVIIPVYNSEKFLKYCVESVLNQSYSDIEIITVDDGSTDESLKILRKYENKITIIEQSNRGLTSSLNAGIKKMNGKWFKWLSPDDVLEPQSIETLVNHAKKLGDNTIVYSNWEIIDQENNKIRDFSESNYNELGNFEFNVRLLDGQQINVNTTLIPSLLFEKGCLIQDHEDAVVVDYDFFLRAGILFGTKFHLVPESLLKYRIHTNQLSHKDISKTLSYLSEVRNQVLSKLDDSKKALYLTALEDYNKQKPITKKTMELGLRFATYTLPDWITDRLLVFYLNKIRSTR